MTEPRDIPLPRLPEPPRPAGFPVLATLAPVVAALGLWAITRSPFALMFAALGPLVAIGSVVDGRLSGRRQARRERARFHADVATTVERIDREHARLRRELAIGVRSSTRILPAALHDAERWRYAGGALPVTLGQGSLASGLRLTGAPAVEPVELPQDAEVLSEVRRPRRRRRSRQRTADAAAVSKAVLSLTERAAVLRDAPVVVDATLGIGVCGRRVTTTAVARAILVQLADALPPGEYEQRGTLEPWQRKLPHHVGEHDGQQEGRVDFVPRGAAAGAKPAATVVVTGDAASLPRECRVGVESDGTELVVLRHPQLGQVDRDGIPLVPDRLAACFVSAPEAGRFALTLSAAADAEGITGEQHVPAQAEIDAAWQPTEPGSGLSASFAVAGGGPVAVDLVADGPHALVGGTTGSGKSELLVSWVMAIAMSRSPAHVNFLLVDFKGGASFGALVELPHCAGLVTDLDESAAARALESLAAELRARERRLAQLRVSAIDDLEPGAMPRLVIVVDEFAAMLAEHPDLHALFADIAARGRSLGVHLILCTQRPAGVVRDSISANCTLRLSLRVNNRHDSEAVIGTASAAELPREPAGRCLIATGEGMPSLVQVARTPPERVREVAERWAGTPSVRRPWLPPLPALISWDETAGHSPSEERPDVPDVPVAPLVPFGVLDRPREQRRALAAWRPRSDGHLLVLGGQGTGRSTALAALAEGAGRAGLEVNWVPGDIESAWDIVMGAGDDGTAGELMLIDDLDALLPRLSEQHASAFVDRLAMLLRDGAGTSMAVAASVQRLTPMVHPLVTLFDSRLLLRLPSRQDHILAGGEGADHVRDSPPGRGRWQGVEVQVADTPRPEPVSRPPRLHRVSFRGSEMTGVVTTRSARIREILDASRAGDDTVRVCTPGEAAATHAVAGGHPCVIVGDPIAWQSAWAAVGLVRAHGNLVFDRCTLTEFRMVAGTATLPPPLSRRDGRVWVLSRDGALVRGGLQLPAPLIVDKFND